MKLLYRVHSCHKTVAAIKAKIGDREVDATVPALVVELVSDDGVHGHTFRIVPDSDAEMADLASLYEPGAAIELTGRRAPEAEEA